METSEIFRITGIDVEQELRVYGKQGADFVESVSTTASELSAEQLQQAKPLIVFYSPSAQSMKSAFRKVGTLVSPHFE